MFRSIINDGPEEETGLDTIENELKTAKLAAMKYKVLV